MTADVVALADLATFAAAEMAARDVEPWADLLAELRSSGAVGNDEALWLVKLYNAYDDLGSAWQVFRRWPTPGRWYTAADRYECADYPCTQERRNLRGGRVIRHLADYAARVGDNQAGWLRTGLPTADPEVNFVCMKAHVRRVWGVGRQTAFEWTEFLGKVMGWPLAAPDADLWESEGPRRSLQRLYGNPKPSLAWLNARAREAREMLRAGGVDLSWEDFETIICDFNVMRDGRYYVGKHLAAIKEEINSVPAADQRMLWRAFYAVVPAPWAAIEPGIDKERLRRYRDTGLVEVRP